MDDRAGAVDDGASAPALRVRGLAFAYPEGRQALFGVDLDVAAGERVAVLGPNGAGKTTLALHLAGALGVPGVGGTGGAGVGTVEVGELLLARGTVAEVRRRVGLVLQDPDDQLFMPTVRDDVAFGPRNAGLRGAALEERVVEALAAVGMGEVADRAPHHLSLGQRRRVAVATVLALRPSVLVLDEPTSNLDPASRRELAEVLAALDVTVLTVTHDLPWALQTCGRAVLLDDGRVVADRTTGALLADADLLAAHRLELPYGFDPAAAAAARTARPAPPTSPGSGPIGSPGLPQGPVPVTVTGGSGPHARPVRGADARPAEDA